MAALENGLQHLGVKLDQVGQVFVSHADPGSGDLVHRIARCTDISVLAHPLAARKLQSPQAHWLAAGELYERSAAAAAFPAASIRAFSEEWRSNQPEYEGLASERVVPLEQDQQAELGGTAWRVEYAPGPAIDHVCLYHEASGVLLSGELLLRRGTVIPYLASKGQRVGLDALRASWLEVGRWTINIAWPLYGPPIRAHRVLISRHQAHWRRRLAEARSAVFEGGTTVWEVASSLGHDDTPELLPLVLRETISLLEWLCQRGTLQRAELEGIVHYSPSKPRR